MTQQVNGLEMNGFLNLPVQIMAKDEIISQNTGNELLYMIMLQNICNN